ncbi:MAG: hypothetical protein WCJ40_05855 [Planctomycetota bacterium]
MCSSNTLQGPQSFDSKALGKALKTSDYVASSGSRSRDPHKSQEEIDKARIKLLSEGILRLMFVYSASNQEIVSAIKLIESAKTPDSKSIEKGSWPNHVPDITNCGNMVNL